MTRKNKRCAPSARAADCVRLATRGEAQCQNAFAVLGCNAQVLRGNGECAMQANGSLTTRLNRFGRVLFPTFSWTAIGVFRFLDEGQPMLLHVHPRDDVPLSCEVSLGAHVGGELWTSGLLDGYGAHLRPSWVQWHGDRLYGGTISPRGGVAFNAYRLHCPMRWTGERCLVVFFSMVGWTNSPRDVARQLEATAFPR